ncbi:uncharacterized protein METZ01_LOCUS299071 [marine metagenome]|uniref:Uncharacterized protein n=1 Tax=marine metagenome TaxID=408172 RepID=A0A382MEP7_9ZZZZ
MKKLLLVFLVFSGCKVFKEPFSLTEKTYQMWRDFIKPTESDLAWTRIQWRTSFQEGLMEAEAKQKPMLLWAMNGHPLGCT